MYSLITLLHIVQVQNVCPTLQVSRSTVSKLPRSWTLPESGWCSCSYVCN